MLDLLSHRRNWIAGGRCGQEVGILASEGRVGRLGGRLAPVIALLSSVGSWSSGFHSSPCRGRGLVGGRGMIHFLLFHPSGGGG